MLRYVPYFGDEDTTGVDVSAYDLVPGEIEQELKSEVRSHLLQLMDLCKAAQLDNDFLFVFLFCFVLFSLNRRSSYLHISSLRSTE